MTLEGSVGLLAEIEKGIANGSMSKDEAKELLEDIQRLAEVEDAAADIDMKGLVLKGAATLMKLV